MSRDDDLRGTLQKYRATIVAKTLPRFQYIALSRPRERAKAGKSFNEFFIIFLNARNLCLLEHDLGNKDGIEVASVPPRQVRTPRTAVMRPDRLFESADGHIWGH
jgi:hypothetical protein